MTKLKNIHPGEILMEEFLSPLNITAYKLSKDIGIPQTRVSEILKGNSQYFGNSAKFWLGIQDDFDIEEELSLKRTSLTSIKSFDTKIA